MKVYLALVDGMEVGGVFDSKLKAEVFLLEHFINKYAFRIDKTASELHQYTTNNVKEMDLK
jgi:hypothetical protein